VRTAFALSQCRPHSSFLLHPFLRFPCLVPRDYHLPFLPRFRARITTPNRKAVRMGQHCWLLLATVLTEILAITKWSKGLFPEPLPEKVFWAWVVGGMALVIYPTVNVRVLLLFFAAPVLLSLCSLFCFDTLTDPNADNLLSRFLFHSSSVSRKLGNTPRSGRGENQRPTKAPYPSFSSAISM
jgi:hypothetical protein